MRDIVIGLMASDNYAVINLTILEKLGCTEALMIGNLINKDRYYNKPKNRKYKAGDYFPASIKYLERDTRLNAQQQKYSLKKLKEHDLVSVQMLGSPSKRYVKLNFENIAKLFNVQENFGDDAILYPDEHYESECLFDGSDLPEQAPKQDAVPQKTEKPKNSKNIYFGLDTWHEYIDMYNTFLDLDLNQEPIQNIGKHSRALKRINEYFCRTLPKDLGIDSYAPYGALAIAMQECYNYFKFKIRNPNQKITPNVLWSNLDNYSVQMKNKIKQEFL